MTARLTRLLDLGLQVFTIALIVVLACVVDRDDVGVSQALGCSHLCQKTCARFGGFGSAEV